MSRRRIVDLPAPLAPTMPTRSPALTENESAVVGGAAPAGIGEVHVLEGDGRREPGGVGRIVRVFDGGPSVEQAEQALGCRARPFMPVCSSARRSRMGRKTSTPIISTMSSTSMPMAPSATRAAPTPSAAAAPTAMPASVMPREAELLASTHIVAAEELVRFLGEEASARAALAEGLERRQALHRVQQLGAVGRVSRLPRLRRLLDPSGETPPGRRG